MKVEFTQLMVGPQVRYDIGVVADLPAIEAKRLIEANIAKAVAETPRKKARQATAKAVENRG